MGWLADEFALPSTVHPLVVWLWWWFISSFVLDASPLRDVAFATFCFPLPRLSGYRRRPSASLEHADSMTCLRCRGCFVWPRLCYSRLRRCGFSDVCPIVCFLTLLLFLSLTSWGSDDAGSLTKTPVALHRPSAEPGGVGMLMCIQLYCSSFLSATARNGAAATETKSSRDSLGSTLDSLLSCTIVVMPLSL